LEGIQKLLRSNRDVGDEIFLIMAKLLGIDIYLTQATGNDFYKISSVKINKSQAPCVVIMGNGYHYEVIATVDKSDYLKVVFNSTDVLIKTLDGTV
jgi:hypothetical protein